MMTKRPSGTDIQARSGGLTVEDVLKGAVIVGGIALGLLILKSLMEAADDKD